MLIWSWLKALLTEFPTLDLVIFFLPISAAMVSLIFVLAAFVKLKCNYKTNYTRKIIHLSLFIIGWMIGYFLSFAHLVVYGIAIAIVGLIIVILGEKNPFYEAVARIEDAPHRSLFLIFPYITSVLGALTLRIFVYDYYFIGILVAGISDALGEPVGVKFGKHSYRVPSISPKNISYRTIEGSSAVFISAFLITFLFLIFVFQVDIVQSYFVALVSGIITAFIEAVSPHGFDNFTVQLSSALPAYFLIFSL